MFLLKLQGKWPKQALWAKDLFGLGQLLLFLDLDSVIVDNMDGYFEYGTDEDVIAMRIGLNHGYVDTDFCF